MKNKISGSIASLLIIVLWTYAAVSKLAAYKTFIYQLGQHAIVGPYATQLAWIIPVFELVIVGLLIVPKTYHRGLHWSLYTLVVFTVYLVIMLGTQPYLPCSCGGVIGLLTWKQHVLLNTFFIVLNIYSMKSGRRSAMATVGNKSF